jgi:hypothetical protein
MLSKLVNAVKWRVIPKLEGFVNIREKKLLSNIGQERNGTNAPRALLIYATNSMGYYLQNRTEEGYKANHHFMFSLGLNMLELLVEHGYVVDCVNRSDFAIEIDHSPYALIIDEGSSMGYMPVIPGQKRVFFASGLRWDRMNANMLQRTAWFNEAYGMKVPPARFQHPGFSDVDADYLMYMGREDQMEDMWKGAKRWQIGMPVYEEATWKGNGDGTDFLWIGSWGALYKGLDIVTDAFAEKGMPTLHVFGYLKKEPQFFEWFIKRIKNFPNIQYHGVADFQDVKTHEVFKKSCGHVYPSAWENGCATVAQTCHFGVIPILTDTANNPADHLGFRVSGNNRDALVNDVRNAVRTVHGLSAEEKKERGAALESFADKQFTRAAFVRDFENLLKDIKQ